MPALPLNLPNVRTTLLRDTEGRNYMQAYARAQSMTDQSVDNVVTASGTLDALRYGDLLKPRGLVGLRVTFGLRISGGCVPQRGQEEDEEREGQHRRLHG